MDTKVLIAALIGFFTGGLLVSTVATTIEKPSDESMSMSSAVQELETKSGDDYDKAFIDHMIVHHESALAMAKLSQERAKHEEIKTVSNEIIKSQTVEINKMKNWYTAWGYTTTTPQHDSRHTEHRH